MRLAIRAEAGRLIVAASGTFSLPEAKRTFLEILDAAWSHQSKAILFDGRQLGGSPSAMERFYYASFAAESLIDAARRQGVNPPRFAYVMNEPVLDRDRFGETVAVNRGMLVKAFDNIEEAEAWLRATSDGDEP